jgi:predicted Zn-dependent protease
MAGCATPQYAIRQTPIPEESAATIEIERSISAVQAKEFEREGARPIGPDEMLWGFQTPRVMERLSRVTERPQLYYRTYLYTDRDPNAAALADGRVYISTGMLDYLASRGSQADELAFILGHELAHTVAQHLVKRYRLLQQQQLIMAIVAVGASTMTRDGSQGLEQVGRLAVDAASVVANVAATGYSQDQELEADQLGIRYVMRAGFKPESALDLLRDFARFDTPWPFLRTHPYLTQRHADLERYLIESSNIDERRRRLLEAQKLYPVGSVSWQNLQRQLDDLERR